jgi:Ca2+-binding RTX toxin-like protein
MAVFNASTRTSSGVTWTPGASDALAKWLNSKSWTGQFQDWAVDSDGDLESIVWSSDGRSTLSFYLSGWRQSGSGFNATGLAFQVLDDLGGADNRAAAFWDGSIYLSRDFKTMTGTVTEIQESTNDDNYWNASGSWDASRLYSGTPDQVISYMFSGSDQITGSRFADIINSGSGDDNITGGGGDDSIDGGTGADKAIFSGAFSGYSFEKDSNGRIVVSDLTTGRDGRDTIAGIETLVFSDKEVSVSALFQPEKPSGPSQPSTPNPTGLEINLLRTSNGAVVRTGDLLGVHYSGVLMDGDGTQFDANYDFAAFSLVPSRSLFTFTVGSGQVIQGWDQALAGRRLGEVLDLTIPAELAYGSAGAPPSIPPDAPLRFRVELVGTIPDGASKAIYPSYQELGVSRKSVAQLKMLGKKFDATKIGTGTDEAMAGGAARDLLIGLDGNDVLEGGARADVLIGGSGANRFVYSAFTDSRPKRGRQDQILGFQRSRDKIDMSALSESVVYIGKKPFSREAGEVRFAGESLQLDADGNGRADLEVLLPGVNRISASNLLF